MTRKPLFFSVIVPLYNKEKYIYTTIERILNQTFQNYEIVIVDDGSTDNSCKIVEEIKDNRIRLIHQKNGGPSKARNRGIQEARGEYVAFIDADDEWLPTKLEQQYELHTKNQNIVWSSTAFVAKGGKREENITYPKHGVVNDALHSIIKGMAIQTSTVIIRKSVFKNHDLLFNENFKRSEDREVWLKMACLFPKIGYVNKVLSLYRVDATGSLSSSGLTEKDFSFLSMPQRIDSISSSIETKKKDMLLAYFNNYNYRKLLSIWGWTDEYKSVKNHFVGHINQKILERLEN